MALTAEPYVPPPLSSNEQAEVKRLAELKDKLIERASDLLVRAEVDGQLPIGVSRMSTDTLTETGDRTSAGRKVYDRVRLEQPGTKWVAPIELRADKVFLNKGEPEKYGNDRTLHLTIDDGQVLLDFDPPLTAGQTIDLFTKAHETFDQIQRANRRQLEDQSPGNYQIIE